MSGTNKKMAIDSPGNARAPQALADVPPTRALRVLIEGTDLTGKSTLAAGLVARLTDSGIQAAHQKGYLYRNPFLRLLGRWEANKYARSAMLNSMYIVSGLIDGLIETMRAKDPYVLVCESYVDRAIAYGIALRLGWISKLALTRTRCFPRFDLCILLRCDYNERISRREKRETVTVTDRLTTRDQHTHEAIANSYAMLVHRHSAVLILDTDEADAEEVLNRCFDSVIQLLRTGAYGTHGRLIEGGKNIASDY
ncbi:hypothetical protein LXA47_27405 [Massilia sp. P8910]|uniref:hypothetical protein n=2 Tax=Massilia antarctica TaxID=2765360 RepID=UPI0006BC201C|nr:hypothetical protein [Massilia antarctica]MCE3607297.1 hypothetical protein [Massilia antarctica]CUI05721.1 hypothetical protein BN2497_6219 [Janthinobacterium sp. CG23_2]CUU29507.1 hypothetical protein BN3177_6219 [Janthinobacterium sp. CG23_2]